jgi:hypothetical protein
MGEILMRSVFTSPRLENVEAVAKMLEEAGIEVRISGDRSYKGNRRRTFSYRDNGNGEPDPQVWIIKAEDQSKARAMLREEGLIDPAPHSFGTYDPAAAQSYLPLSATTPIARKTDRRMSLVMRARLFLLALITLITILALSGAFHR